MLPMNENYESLYHSEYNPFVVVVVDDDDGDGVILLLLEHQENQNHQRKHCEGTWLTKVLPVSSTTWMIVLEIWKVKIRKEKSLGMVINHDFHDHHSWRLNQNKVKPTKVKWSNPKDSSKVNCSTMELHPILPPTKKEKTIGKGTSMRRDMV